jgi:hypothetical protein
MRTSPWERAFVWAEAREGRLRQGWGSVAEGNLDVIAELVRRGVELTEEQKRSWPARRMRTGEPDGIRVGDVVVTPHLPVLGRLSVFRVVGSYRYEMVTPRGLGERFGHVLPVALLAADIDRRSAVVSDGLRAMLRPQGRLYNITAYGGEVELLLGNEVEPAFARDRSGEPWTEGEYAILFGRFPPTGHRPTNEQVAAMAADWGRTFDAVRWQWEDGASYCTGGSASTTSEALKAWLDRTGACGASQ